MKLYEFFPKSISYLRRSKCAPVYLTSQPAPVSDDYPLRIAQEKELQRLLRKGGRHILLHGPGGTGKTYMARKLFYLLSNDFERLAWVEYGSDMRTALSVAFPGLNNIEDPDLRFSKIIRKLGEDPQKTILFIDDVKENAINDDILARLTGLGITIFMTSRCEKIPPYETHRIAAISATDCVELFYSHYSFDLKRKHSKAIRKVSELLDYNVFAILLLARVIGPERNLDSHIRKLSAELRAEKHASEKLTLFIGQLLNLAKLTYEEKRSLQCYALMPSGEVPSIVNYWFNISSTDTVSLVNKGWLEWNQTTNTYILHDLLRQYFIDCTISNAIISQFLQKLVQEDFFSNSDSDDITRYKLDAAKQALGHADKQSHIFVFSYYVLGDFFRGKSQHTEAITCYNEALVSAKSQEPFPSDVLLNILWNLGLSYEESCQYSQALECFCRVEQHYQEHKDTDQLFLAKIWNNIGGSYMNMGKGDLGLEYLQKSLSIKERIQGVHHPDTASSYNNVGAAYGSLCNYPKALDYFMKSVAIYESINDTSNPEYASTYYNIGHIYRSLCDFQKALEYYKKALDLQKITLHKNHPNIARTYNSIGNLYSDLNDSENALSCLNEALTIQEHVLGINHPDTATTYSNIANVYSVLGKNMEALEFRQKALEIYLQILGSEHPHTAMVYSNIGNSYCDMGNFASALKYHNIAKDILERVLGNAHPDTALIYGNIGSTYKAMDENDAALMYCLKAFSIFQEKLGPSHNYTQKAYRILKKFFQDIYPDKDFFSWLTEQVS